MDLSYGSPFSYVDILLLPGALVLFAVFVRFLIWTAERNSGKKSKAKWLPYLLAIGGLILGSRTLWALINPATGSLYRSTINSRKILYSHWVAFLLPLLTIVVLIVWDKWAARRPAEEY